MKKIICLIESLGSGGAERQLTGLAILLKQLGHIIEVWYYAPSHFYCKDLDEAGVKYRFIEQAQNKRKRVGIIRRKLLSAKPDTVITYLDTPSIIGCITKITGGKFNLIVSERNTTQKLTRKEKIKFFLYRFANHIVPNSFSQTKFINTHYPNLSKKVTCITNFVDTDKFSPAENKPQNNPIKILTVARIMPQKNVINYIKAIKLVVDKYYNVEVSWFGNSTSQEYYEKCCQTIIEHGLENTFKFYPATTNIIEEYHKSDIFCLPSTYEGFPNVVCEAMSCGLPILCSNVCDNPNIVTNDVGILFSPNNIEDISNNIINFISKSSEELTLLSNNSRSRAIELFAKEIFINKYNNII